jgi:hypothetical protein
MTTFLGGLTDAERAALKTVRWGSGEIHAVEGRKMFALVSDILETDPFRFVTDDLGLRREMVFLRDLARDHAGRTVRQTPGGEIWEWTPAGGGETIRIGGEMPGSEICLRAAREILSAAGPDAALTPDTTRSFFARLAAEASP